MCYLFLDYRVYPGFNRTDKPQGERVLCRAAEEKVKVKVVSSKLDKLDFRKQHAKKNPYISTEKENPNPHYLCMCLI